MLFLMKNAKNTSSYEPNQDENWKEFWKSESGKPWPYYCAVYGCPGRAEVGAHVQKVGDYSGAMYIAPLCYSHNNDHDATFYIDDSMLVRIK